MAKCSYHSSLLVFFLVGKSKSHLSSCNNISLPICFNVCVLKKLQQMRNFTLEMYRKTYVRLYLE